MDTLMHVAVFVLLAGHPNIAVQPDSTYEHIMLYLDTVQVDGDGDKWEDWSKELERRRYRELRFAPDDYMDRTYYDSPWARICEA